MSWSTLREVVFFSEKNIINHLFCLIKFNLGKNSLLVVFLTFILSLYSYPSTYLSPAFGFETEYSRA